MKDFFVSYTNSDEAWANWIAWILEDNGYSVVIQAWDFRPGGNFVLEMHEAVKGTRATVAILSNYYLNSVYTQPEWASAFAIDPSGRHRTLIPIRIDKCKPTGLLATIIHLDISGLSEQAAQSAIIKALSERAKPSVAPPFPKTTYISPSPINRVAYPGATNMHIVDIGKKGFAELTDLPNKSSIDTIKNSEVDLSLISSFPPIELKSCNRKKQYQEFLRFFTANLHKNPGLPHLYIIQGEEREAHSSLVERFSRTRIQEYANQIYGKHKASLCFLEIEWPVVGELSWRHELLISSLFEQIEKGYSIKKPFIDKNYSSEALCKLSASSGQAAIIIEHRIFAKEWDNISIKLIRSYLSFWSQVKCNNSPRFYIFLDIVYHPLQNDDQLTGWQKLKRRSRIKRIKYELGKIRRLSERADTPIPSRNHCPYLLLEEMLSVDRADMMDWLRRNTIDGYNDQEKWCDELFKTKDGRIAEWKTMAEIEHKLYKLYQISYRRDRL